MKNYPLIAIATAIVFVFCNESVTSNKHLERSDIVGNWTSHKFVPVTSVFCNGDLVKRAYTFCISLDSMNHRWIDSCNGEEIVQGGDERDVYEFKNDSLLYAYNRIFHVVNDSTWTEYLYIRYRVQKINAKRLIFTTDTSTDTCSFGG